MDLALVLLAGALTASAPAAAPVTGRVVDSAANPIPDAEVLLYPKGGGRPQVACADDEHGLSPCLCPESVEGFLKSLSSGLPGPAAPLARTRTGADGRFSLESPAPGKAMLLATSADGKLTGEAEAAAPGEPVELEVEPVLTREVALTLPAGVRPVLFLRDPVTGALLPPLSVSGRRAVFGPVRSWDLPMAFALASGHQTTTAWLRDDWTAAEPSLQLLPAARVEGHVDLDGKPVAGAQVRLAQQPCRTVAKTDAQGRFSLPRIYGPPGLTEVLASQGTRVARAYVAYGESVELSLEATGRLELTFVDEAGKPVAGAVVFGAWRPLRKNAVPTHLRATTDAKGQIAFQDLEPGTAEALSLDGWVQLEPEQARLEKPQPAKVTLRVTRGVDLRGVVVTADGKPLARAMVEGFLGEELQAQLGPGAKKELHLYGRSGPTGRFLLRALLPGAYEISVKHLALGEATARARAPGEEVKVVMPQESFGLDVTVQEPGGKPAAGIDVYAQQKGLPQQRSGSSDAQGRVHLALPTAGPWQLSARKKRGAAASATVEVQPGANAATLPLPAPLLLVGSVVDPDGKPAVGAEVLAISQASPWGGMAVAQAMQSAVPRKQAGPGAVALEFSILKDAADRAAMSRMTESVTRATTGAEGRFSLEIEGDVMIGAESGELSTATLAKPGQLTLTLERHASARGRVVDSKGKPVPIFTIDGRQQFTSDGLFRVSLAAKPEQTLTFAAPSHCPATRKLQLGTGVEVIDLGDVELSPSFILKGVVLDGVSKAPLNALRVKAKAGEIQKSATSDEAGLFEIQELPMSEVRLTVSASSGDWAPTAVSAKPGAGKVEIKVFKNASLKLTVLEPRTQRPLGNISVEAQGPERVESPGPDKRSHDTDQNGRAHLKGLAPGRWTLTFDHGQPRTLDLKPGESRELEIAVGESKPQ
ncbi:MAG TPA: hypothetical protein VGK67_28025 [Myxococcales bacterium]|jgi:hypothetical protein